MSTICMLLSFFLVSLGFAVMSYLTYRRGDREPGFWMAKMAGFAFVLGLLLTFLHWQKLMDIIEVLLTM